MRAYVVAAIAASLALPSAGRAQDTAAPVILQRGEKVRYRVAGNRSVFIGRVLFADERAMLLDPGSDGPVTVPFSSLVELQLGLPAKGPSKAGKGAVIGGSLGGALGGVLGYYQGAFAEPPIPYRRALVGAALGGGFGAALGAILGKLTKTQRWEQLPLPHRVQVTAGPMRGRGIAAAVSVRF
jgi:hypothetical protein